jgi:hypothetical protein
LSFGGTNLLVTDLSGNLFLIPLPTVLLTIEPFGNK